VELTATDSLVDKLDRARALLSHKLPGCDIADVIEQAVTMLVERLEAKRFGARRTKKTTSQAATMAPKTADPTDADQAPPRPSESSPTGAEARATPAGPSLPSVPSKPPVPSKPSRYVPAQVRRAVYERDGARCAHIDTEGRRCTEQGQLEIDHIVPWALGGPTTVDNLRLACRGHNAQAARQAFGAAFIDRWIERRRETQRVASEERRPDDGQWLGGSAGAT
jgi:5-methylcytosine-specific restriction endonuclease McrA